ncbi:MAG: tRNA 2-thiouridine(34) synthase MnmA [Myxococcales bacterium]|nr:tRNA 2-thiouridine(34) synthase MnmA [Myxococcales bacterium]
MRRVVVGMSGGVDSSVAALLLQRQGYEVIGVTLHLWDYVKDGHAGRCCAPEDQYDAARVAERLGIAHYTFDRRALFQAKVVDPFVDTYRAGRTPSPCVRCNESVKLGPMFEIARRLGAERVATGHYARVAVEGGEVVLRAAVDGHKDQSYFLWVAPEEALRALELPLGGLTKPEARALAAAAGFVNAAKPDSSDLCFVEGGRHASFVAARSPEGLAAGPIETVTGEVIGHHDGIHQFTPGQRKGTGAGGPARYVLRVIASRNAVVVGTADEATQSYCEVGELRWLTAQPVDAVTARIRYRHTGVKARVEVLEGGRARLHFSEPQRGVAPGQAAAFYVGDRVVGGGFIDQA